MVVARLTPEGEVTEAKATSVQFRSTGTRRVIDEVRSHYCNT